MEVIDTIKKEEKVEKGIINLVEMDFVKMANVVVVDIEDIYIRSITYYPV